MGFDIPMSTTGCMGANDLLNLTSGGSMQSQPQMSMQSNNIGVQSQQMNVQPQQMNVQPQMGMQSQPQAQAGSGVILKKGQKVNLASNTGVSLTNIRIGLGWDVINQACDLDASAFILGADGKVLGDDWFVFYGQTTSPDGSVVHSGDSSGVGLGDDETIDINLTVLNPNAKEIIFVVTIDEALEKGLNFSMVQNAYVRVTDVTTGAELIRFNLSDYYANVTSMMVGKIYNHNGQWKFNAIGDGVAKDLAGLCAMYGVNVAG